MANVSKSDYNTKKNAKYEEKILLLLQELPDFCSDYFKAIRFKTEPRTRIAYIGDIKFFLEYTLSIHTEYDDIKDLCVTILDEITTSDIDEFLIYASQYTRNGDIYQNNDAAMRRKLSSIRSFYKYFFNSDIIKTNPAVKVEMPTLHKKKIVRLENDESRRLLNTIEYGNGFTPQMERYRKKNKERDYAIISVFLGTGIRVSELHGLNLNDVNMQEQTLRVIRKGGNEEVVYFNDDVYKALEDYINIRKTMFPSEGHIEALFLSTQRTRLGVRAIEKLVKKYATASTPNKKITPHKLRSTFGTNLYNKTGDIYMCANALGHASVETTKAFYSDIEEERKKQVKNIQLF